MNIFFPSIANLQCTPLNRQSTPSREPML